MEIKDKEGEFNTKYLGLGSKRRSSHDLNPLKKSLASSFYQYRATAQEPGDAATLGTWGTVLAIMSTVVGGGMVSLPWAFLQTGIYFAFGYLLLMVGQVALSTVLYLKARELCPFRTQSMQEVGFVVLGRKSIFWISFIILINSLGLLIIFFSVFGDTAASIVSSILET